MNIKKKFLKLTKKTYPHGTENELKNHLPNGYKSDGLGNFFIQIGNSTTMFTCHLDTADRSQSQVRHIINGNIIKTDGTSILGADDKAGMTVMLYMIEKNIPGLYYFFIGEERGCVGSSRLSRTWLGSDLSKIITKCVSFDRRDVDSIITEQFGGVCCSLGFAKELSNRLNVVESTFKYSPDPTGIYTDSAQFTDLIPECTNISVGYYNEHTSSERQDIAHLEKLCEAVCKIDWETLPIIRVPSYYYEDDEDDDFFYEEDQLFQPHNFSWFRIDGQSKKMMISDARIEQEKSMILAHFKALGSMREYFDFNWDGRILQASSHLGQYQSIANRNELMEMITDLCQIEIDQLKNFS